MSNVAKEVLLDLVKDRLCEKSADDISKNSIVKIADILNIDLEEEAKELI